MPGAIHSRAFFPLLFAFSLLLTGCATIGGKPSERVTFTSRDTSVKLTPRERVATVTRETPERLANQGYAELGDLTVAYTKERCFGNHCDPKSHSKTPTERLLREAAKHGSDVVILRQDNVSSSKGVTRQGRCLRNESVWTSVPYWKCDYRSVCDRNGFCRSEQTNCRTEYRSGYELKCAAYNTEVGNETVVESVGTVWRYDPDLAKQAKQMRLGKEFFLAASRGDLRVVQDGLAQGLSPNAANPEGRPLLVAAASNGQKTVVSLLIERGADVNGRDKQGATALYAAAGAGHTEIVKALLARGADVNVKNNWGWTPLFTSAYSGHTETGKALLISGADVNVRNNGSWTPLMTAASHGKTETVKVLLAHGADVNAKDKDGATALISPASSGKTATVQALLAGGADMNAKPNDGQTALILAAEWGHTAAVQALLAKGADVSARDKYGGTALMYATKKGHTAVVKLLKQASAKE